MCKTRLFTQKGKSCVTRMEKLQHFSFGKDTAVQQASLRKKMKEHFSSKTHRICLEQLQHRANDQITKSMDALNQKRI